MAAARDPDRICAAMLAKLKDAEHRTAPMQDAFRKVVTPVFRDLLTDQAVSDTLRPNFENAVAASLAHIQSVVEDLRAQSEDTARQFGIKEGLMTTTHAYTNDQRLADVPHKDWRRGRAAAENIIPTTTGAAKAVGKVIPELAGKLDGMASRVPVPDGSVVDLVIEVEKDVTVEDIHAAVRVASKTKRLEKILLYSEDMVVSSDIVGKSYSSIYDPEYTKVLGKRIVRTLNWYDNEWGYSNRVVDLITMIMDFDK
jgi:glyceraldehyde-3-phosphate dehydrogenase type I